jgi:hypothetical protein
MKSEVSLMNKSQGIQGFRTVDDPHKALISSKSLSMFNSQKLWKQVSVQYHQTW